MSIHADALNSRSIAIIGAGLTGLGFLQSLVDLPPEAKPGWTIDCFERRGEVGGIWHPQPKAPSPPMVPETPMYDDFQTVTLSTGITFPNRPLPPSTPLFSNAQVIQQYIVDHVRDFRLSPYINLNHTVTSMKLSHPDTKHPWTLQVQHEDHSSLQPVTETRRYSTVIIGTGVTDTPKMVVWPGQDVWLAASPKRTIIHSMWYRNADFAKGRFMIVLGYHPSGAQVARDAVKVAKEVYHSYTMDPAAGNLPVISGDNYHPIRSRIASSTRDMVIFEDGTRLSTPNDAVIVECTGYKRTSYPMLHDLIHDVPLMEFSYDDPTYPLEANVKYIRPLYKCIIPLTQTIPLGSLAFGCLFPIIWNFPTSYAQGIWFAHVLANLDAGNSLLPSNRESAFEEIRKLEKQQEAMGPGMAKMGYQLQPIGQSTDDYADELVQSIRTSSRFTLPEYLLHPKERPYTEAWRRRAFQVTLPLIRAWEVAKKKGVAGSFSEGCATEGEYAEAVEMLVEWWDSQAKDVVA